MEHCADCQTKSPLFNKLSEEELARIEKHKVTKCFSKGEVIFSINEPINEFVYLSSGLVKLTKINKFGKEQIVTIARPKDMVGLLTVFSNSNYQYTMTALVDSKVCFVGISAFRELTITNPQFAIDVIKTISSISDDIIRHTYAINSKNLRGRIALILMDFSENIYESDNFELPLSRKELAEMIDMTPENVIRILSEFKRDDLIRVKGKNIELINKRMIEKVRDLG